jgi:hypothetical protein
VPAKKSKEWSAVGAARFAREARISTAKFLASAPLAQLWEVNKVINAYGYHHAHLGDHEAAMDMLLGNLGYQRPYPRGWEAIAGTLVTDEAHYLAEAELYVLTPHMCDVVTAAALTLTREDLQQLGEGDLPSPTGLVILPHPLLVRAVTGDLGDDRAYRWRTPAQIWPMSAGSHARRAVPAVGMSVYHDAHGPVQPDSFLKFAAQARAARTPLPPLILDAKRCLPFHFDLTDEQAEDHDEFSRRTRRLGQASRELEQAQGVDENRVTGEYTPGSEIDDTDDLFMPRFLFAFWRLCEQRIAVPEHTPVNHSAQVLADRAGVSPEVRIVRLRRAEQQPGEPGAGEREWKHRWTVRMHKVNQWYPSEGKHKVIYRGPYLKGPEGKPMLDGETVRGLVR